MIPSDLSTIKLCYGCTKYFIMTLVPADEVLFIDCDAAILTSPQKLFDMLEHDIRLIDYEFKHLPDWVLQVEFKSSNFTIHDTCIFF